jgi:hypothetical protein
MSPALEENDDAVCLEPREDAADRDEESVFSPSSESSEKNSESE